MKAPTPSREEVVELGESECYYVCKDYNLEDAYNEVIKVLSPKEEFIVVEGCPACIAREIIAKLKAKTYMALTPSGAFIEFYVYGKTVYEILSEEGERPLITVTSYSIEKLRERIEELRMQALISANDAENLMEWANE